MLTKPGLVAATRCPGPACAPFQPRATLVPGTLDLDLAAAGVQTMVVTAAGTSAVQPGDEVLSTPAVGSSAGRPAHLVAAGGRRRWSAASA